MNKNYFSLIFIKDIRFMNKNMKIILKNIVDVMTALKK